VDNRHARWVFKLVLAIAFALTPLAVYLLQTMSYVETSYAIEDLRGREARTIESEHRLIIEKAVLQSLPAVEKRAGAQLGLERAPDEHRLPAIGEIDARDPRAALRQHFHQSFDGKPSKRLGYRKARDAEPRAQGRLVDCHASDGDE
jgi:hypothetical protein